MAAKKMKTRIEQAAPPAEQAAAAAPPSHPPPLPGMQPGVALPGMQPGAALPGMQPGAALPGMQPGAALPGMQPGAALPGMQPGAALPGMQPGAVMPGMQPLLAMMQMMQMMASGGAPVVDPAAVPFSGAPAMLETDKGLDADIIRPALIVPRIKNQAAVPTGSVLDWLCLTEDGKNALGGIPKGCTMALAGPPGKGKTRTALAAMVRVALSGVKVAFVVAEEGFHDTEASGRDDLCSRLTKIGMATTGLSEAELADRALARMFVLESQYHKSHTWDDFVSKYRFLVEKESIRFVVIDSLNMLDPTKNRTADNLSALKTYNHTQGITCVCVGQIRDTGMPVGGEALQHTADAVFLIEEFGLASKEQAELWGGKYRDKIDIVSAVKSVTTPVFPYPIRVGRDPATGIMVVHESQPEQYRPLPPR